MTKLKDCIYGLAIGDALGVPYEFRKRDTFTCDGMTGLGTYNKPAGTYSDDTGMALATLDSIAEIGRVNTSDMRSRYKAWLYNGRYMPDNDTFDVGHTTRDALKYGYGLNDEYSNGNGSLMRIAPLAFFDTTDDQVRDVSAITHAHKVSTDLCVAFVQLLRDVVFDKEQAREDIIKTVGHLERGQVQSTGFVVHTFTAALWCFATTETYRDCVLKAVNLGSDTDTTACVAGALAGTYYGIGNIPMDWIVTLRNKGEIERILDKVSPEKTIEGNL